MTQEPIYDYAEFWFDKNQIDAALSECGINPKDIKCTYSYIAELALDQDNFMANLRKAIVQHKDSILQS